MAREGSALGGRVAVELWADDRARGAAAIAAVLAEAQRIDRQLSAQRPDGELALLNQLAGIQDVRIGDEAFQVLARAQEFDRASDGALALVAGPCQGPTWRQLRLSAAGPTAGLTQPGQRVELAPLLTGHALNRAVALLRRLGVRHARLEAGSLEAWLGDRRGQPWALRGFSGQGLPALHDIALARSRRAWVAGSDAMAAVALLQVLAAAPVRPNALAAGRWPGVLAWGFAEGEPAEAS